MHLNPRTTGISTLAIGILLQSCIVIKHSTLRNPVQEPVDINNCQISSTGPVYLNILGLVKADFMPAGVKVECGNHLVYADPILVDDTAKADFIFITHTHLDHFLPADIEKLSDAGTLVIGPSTIARKLKNRKIKIVRVGDTLNLGYIQCDVVDSYNLQSKIHKKDDKTLGYVISMDGTRIYIPGDTDLIPEMKDLKDITVALVPIGEGKTAMDPQSAAEAVNLINPVIAIPIHYKLGENREEEFKDSVNKEIEVRIFPHRNKPAAHDPD